MGIKIASLTRRRVVLAVTGGVAAYKAAFLCRLLTERGADVKVVLTEEAVNFVGPTTFAAITGHSVIRDLFSADLVSPHTELARWADVVVVAPATAATVARLALGISEEPVSATLLATRAPVLIAPAMHTEMWEHPATARNIRQLEADGHQIIGPASGALAGGDEGMGRMAEPEEIVEALERMLTGRLSGLRVLVTAGGTREAIDPVRFIGNRSSGKMGHAIADVAATRGAEVVLVTASELPAHHAVKVIRVESAQEMADASSGIEADVAILAAAVADFRPVHSEAKKISRSEGPPEIVLERTPDVLASVVAREPRPFVVGFAAETGDLQRAVAKADAKGVDLLVANDVTAAGAGFGTETNKVTIIYPGGRLEHWDIASKPKIAERLWDLIAEELDRAR